MTTQEKINDLNRNDRVEIKLIGNKLPLRYKGRFTVDTGDFLHMIDENDNTVVIYKPFIEDVIADKFDGNGYYK